MSLMHRYRWQPSVLVAAVGLGAVVALHVRGLPGSFLADDLAFVAHISSLDRAGTLGHWLLARLTEAAYPGNFAYRPVMALSYATDWRLFHAHAAGWHLTSLVLHICNALLVGVFVARWARGAGQGAGMIAAAVFAAYPFAGEVSFWISGRANLLAAFFGLLFLLTFDGRQERAVAPLRQIARVTALYAALLSNESAMPLPLVATFLVASTLDAAPLYGERKSSSRMRVTTMAHELGPTWLAFLFYIAWRYWLFGTPVKVYAGSSLPSGPADYIDRLFAIGALFSFQPDMQPTWVWLLVALGLVLAIAVFARTTRSPRTLLGVVRAFTLSALIYVLAPALAFAGAAANGDGARNYYLAWVFIAGLLGLVSTRSRPTYAAVVVLIGWFLVAQDGSLRQWQRASAAMRAVIAAIPGFAQEVDKRQYAALLLPDHMGIALFVRNAQGAVVMRPVQRIDYIDRVAAMTELDIDNWRHALANNGFESIRGAPLAPSDFIGVFCFVPAERAFVKLVAGGGVPDETWAATLRAEAAKRNCLPGTFHER